MTTALLELVEGESKVCGRTGYRTRDLWLLSQTRTDYATRSGSVCVCEGYLYSHVSHGKFYFEKIIAIFSGGKTSTCTWKSFYTCRVAKQTFILPTCIRKLADCATQSGSVCLCLCVYLYRHVSGGKFYFEKIIAIFSGSKNFYVFGEKLPYLLSGYADVYTYLHASENSVMQYNSTTLEKMLLNYAAFPGRTLFGCLIKKRLEISKRTF